MAAPVEVGCSDLMVPRSVWAEWVAALEQNSEVVSAAPADVVYEPLKDSRLEKCLSQNALAPSVLHQARFPVDR